MKRAVFILGFLVLLSLIGCSLGEETTETQGYILEVETGTILLAENLTEEQYHEIKDTPIKDLVSQSAVPRLIYLSYSRAESFKKGDEVAVVITGGIEESYPAKAKARKIKKQQATD